MFVFKVIITLFLSALSTTPMADVHKCVDRAGAITYTSEGCPTTSKKKLVVGERPAIKFTGEKITLNFYEVELRSVFRVLADFSGIRMNILPSVSGNATIAVNDRSWDEVFVYLINQHNLTWKKIDNTIYVGKDLDFR